MENLRISILYKEVIDAVVDEEKPEASGFSLSINSNSSSTLKSIIYINSASKTILPEKVFKLIEKKTSPKIARGTRLTVDFLFFNFLLLLKFLIKESKSFFLKSSSRIYLYIKAKKNHPSLLTKKTKFIIEHIKKISKTLVQNILHLFRKIFFLMLLFMKLIFKIFLYALSLSIILALVSGLLIFLSENMDIDSNNELYRFLYNTSNLLKEAWNYLVDFFMKLYETYI